MRLRSFGRLALRQSCGWRTWRKSADDDPRDWRSALAEIPLCPAPAAGQPAIAVAARCAANASGSAASKRRTAAVTGSETVTVLPNGGRSASLAASGRSLLRAFARRHFEAERRAEPSRRSRSSVKLRHDARSERQRTGNPPPIVDHGASVTVHGPHGGRTITTSGKALEAGAAGETICVELADTKQRVWPASSGRRRSKSTAGHSGPPASTPSIAILGFRKPARTRHMIPTNFLISELGGCRGGRSCTARSARACRSALRAWTGGDEGPNSSLYSSRMAALGSRSARRPALRGMMQLHDSAPPARKAGTKFRCRRPRKCKVNDIITIRVDTGARLSESAQLQRRRTVAI